jgi:hypothetical protein
MSAAELLRDCEAKGVVLSVRDGSLRFRCPRGTMTPLLRDALAKNKSGLLSLLRPDGDFGPDDWDDGTPDIPAHARPVFTPDGSFWTTPGAVCWFPTALCPPPFSTRA